VCANRTAIGYEFDGGFAEYVKIPAEAIRSGNIFPISPTLPIEEAALLEPLSCCICGQRKLPIVDGDTLLIVGAGSIGLMHLKLARNLPGSNIIVSDPSPQRLKAAQASGANAVINPVETDLYEEIISQTHGLGVDKVILAASVPEIIGDLLKCIRKGGGINLFAGTGIATLDANLIHYNEITVVGSSASTVGDFARAIDLLETGKVKVDDLILHTFDLSQFTTAIEHVRAGHGIKTIFQFEE
jgi:L-iditol 2-dehydrogenase